MEPLSATTTSPKMPAFRNAASAVSMQRPIDCASLRQGITTETSGACCASQKARAPSSCASKVFALYKPMSKLVSVAAIRQPEVLGEEESKKDNAVKLPDSRRPQRGILKTCVTPSLVLHPGQGGKTKRNVTKSIHVFHHLAGIGTRDADPIYTKVMALNLWQGHKPEYASPPVGCYLAYN